MQISDIMSRNIKVVSPDLSVCEAAKLMRDIDTGFLPVGENDRLIGSVTDRDIAVRAVAEGQGPQFHPGARRHVKRHYLLLRGSGPPRCG